MRRIAVLALIVFAASFGAACQKQEVNINSGGLLTGPSPTVVVTEVSVTASQLSFELNSCPSVVVLTATAKGVNAPQEFIWSSTGGGEFSYSGNTATFGISRAGEYTGTATSKFDPTRSGTVKIVATGDCGGSTPPPGIGDFRFTVNPSTIDRGGVARIEWDATGANSCFALAGWTGTRPTRGSFDVSPQETVNYHLTCDGVTKTVTVTVRGSAPPPPPPSPPTPPPAPPPTPPTPTPTPTPSVWTIEVTAQFYSGGAGTTVQASVVCRLNGVVTACPSGNPQWHSSASSRVAVNGSTGLVTFGTIPGDATITAQKSFGDTTVIGSKVFTRN